MLRPASAVMVLAFLACSRDEGRPAPPSVPAASSSRSSLDSLLGALAELEGSFPAQGPPAIGDFSGDRSVLTAIADRGDSAVVRLVACMTKTEPTAVTKGRRLKLGELCYAALVNTAYYEATDARGDVSPDWPGHVDLPATSSQLQAAKQAWDSVVARRAYHLL
jgi:hypothetical protein